MYGCEKIRDIYMISMINDLLMINNGLGNTRLGTSHKTHKNDSVEITQDGEGWKAVTLVKSRRRRIGDQYNYCKVLSSSDIFRSTKMY